LSVFVWTDRHTHTQTDATKYYTHCANMADTMQVTSNN